MDIEKQLKTLPEKPGVYIMKDVNETVIYVGKAIILKNRVRQYFRSFNNHSPKVKAMVSNIDAFEYIITDNELEALILECNLIKKYRPKYNILLRDDKTYPYIKVTIGEDYPRILKVRQIKKDKSKYFGPYTNIAAVNETLDIIERLYPIRNCNLDMQKCIKNHMRPCLEYYIHNCIGPCTGKVSVEEYKKYIDEILDFLSGKSNKVIDNLKANMRKAASEQRYEDAAIFRDKISSIEDTLMAQKITKTDTTQNRDIIAVATNGVVACVEVFFVRNGRLVGRENFIVDGIFDETIADILSNFIEQFYFNQKYIPNEIVVEKEIANAKVMELLLTKESGHSVTIKEPLKGDKLKMVNLVKKNALEYLNKFVEPDRKREKNNVFVLDELKNMLGMTNIPRRIESYDISNIQGTDSIGAMVVYIDGKRDRNEYRRYKIKTIEGANDVGSMAEILTRRLKYGNYPDLILLDGGAPQVNSVQKVLDEYGLDIELWGLYKDDKHRTKGLTNIECEIELDRTSNIYKFLAGIQEEVHRYAITYHRSLRDKNMIHSALDDIKGVGKVKKLALLERFTTVDNIKLASVDDIAKVKGINLQLAKKIKDYLLNK